MDIHIKTIFSSPRESDMITEEDNVVALVGSLAFVSQQRISAE